jgi:hypothetical protein
MSLAIVLGLGLVFGPSIYADDPAPALDSITISPVNAKLQLEPGTVTDGTFKVINTGSNELVFKVYATPFYVNDNDYDNLQFANENNRTQLSRWISFDQTDYTLAPSATAVIAYRISVPDSVPAGGQYAAIMAESIPANSGEGIAAASRVGMLVYSSIAGTTIEDGKILGNNIGGWYQTSPVKTTINVRNDGNTDFTVSSTLKVYNVFGAEVYNSGVRENQVLPETSRNIPLDWESDSRVGFYTIKQEVTTLGKSETFSRVVLLMPAWLLIILIVIIVAVIALIVIKLRGSSAKNKTSAPAKPAPKKPVAKRK